MEYITIALLAIIVMLLFANLSCKDNSRERKQDDNIKEQLNDIHKRVVNIEEHAKETNSFLWKKLAIDYRDLEIKTGQMQKNIDVITDEVKTQKVIREYTRKGI